LKKHAILSKETTIVPSSATIKSWTQIREQKQKNPTLPYGMQTTKTGTPITFESTNGQASS
jgi:hypothetical protein